MNTSPEFLLTIDGAIAEYLNGSTQLEVCKRYYISRATLGRHLQKRGVSLSPEEKIRRRVEGARKKRSKKRKRCPAGCMCWKHTANRSNVKHEIILGRKNCARCTRWRSILDYYVRTHDVDGNPLGFQTICKACQAEVSRVSAGMIRRGKPYQKRKPPMTKGQKAAKRRRRYKKLMKNPEYAADRREYARIYAEAKRREAGVPVREKTIANREIEESPRLSTVPLKRWIEHKLNNGYKGNLGALALACKSDSSLLNKIRTDHFASVSVSMVDSMLLSEGSTNLPELYPHPYDG